MNRTFFDVFLFLQRIDILFLSLVNSKVANFKNPSETKSLYYSTFVFLSYSLTLN